MSEFIPALSSAINHILSRPDYRPMTRTELARALELPLDERRDFRLTLRRMEQDGVLVCLRHNRWALASRGGPNPDSLTGILKVSPRGTSTVRLDRAGPGGLLDVLVADSARVGAMPGDRVTVELEPRATERRTAAYLRGRIVGVTERTRTIAVGTFRHTRISDSILPDDPGIHGSIRVVEVPAARAEKLEGHKVVVRLEPWRPAAPAPCGHLIEDLGPADAPGVDMLSLLRRHEMDAAFPPAVMRAALRRAGNPAASDLEGRWDLRGQLSFTVDPETARDFDDAISLVPGPDGGWILDVHIADVAHFVPRGSSVDREACQRGNTVYLVDRAILMLPQELTSDTCSLSPDQDRLARTVRLELSDDGRVLRSRQGRSVIRSRARLTYTQVAQAQAGDESAVPADVRETLRNLTRLTQRLRDRRMHAGALDLQLPELDCRLDAKGRVIELLRRDSAATAYQMIEECMLLANTDVARRLTGAGRPALFRTHDEPDELQWAKMAEDLRQLNLTLTDKRREQINSIAWRVRGTPMQDAFHLAVLRNLKRALYQVDCSPHFGLAFEEYTHFTSPIRRYPDLIVHRLLDALEHGARSPYGKADLVEIAAHCNATERAADEASAESVDIKRLQYYADEMRAGRIGPHPAIVTGVNSRGILVELSATMLRGMIPLSRMERTPSRSSRHGPGRRSQRDATRSGWTLGDRLDVELVRVDTLRRLVDFRPAGTTESRKPALPRVHRARTRGRKN